jgi:hypothetical protein
MWGWWRMKRLGRSSRACFGRTGRGLRVFFMRLLLGGIGIRIGVADLPCVVLEVPKLHGGFLPP